MHTLSIKTTAHRQFVDITADIERLLVEHSLESGVCYLFCPHTTAAITLNESWDPDVRRDMTLALDTIVPQRADFKHAEGNSPAHVKTSLVGSDHFIFVQDSHLILGRWQGVYLAEFDGPRTRQIYIKFRPD